MNTTGPIEIQLPYQARPNGATAQDTLPGRYHWWVMALAMGAFTLAFLGWLNESWLYLFESPIWLNRYTEYAIILAFGIWRIRAERNPYTRKRLIILVAVVTALWWLVPWLLPMFEPYVGYVWNQPVFPALHTPGTLTFFLVLVLVLLFGRRVICGFGCPCVGIRETVGFPFRHITLRSDWAWRLRHTKWFFFAWYLGVMVATQFPPSAWTATLVGLFGMVVGLSYFGSFFLIPLTGNRFYCRYLCPFGATFGLLNHAGLYGIKMNQNQCIDCQRCEQSCDMGIPVWRQGKASGEVTGIEDCMGCARCVVSCPTDALEIRDLRNLLRPQLRQHASRLLKRPPLPPQARIEAPRRPAEVRVGDWDEAESTISDELLQQQARRCLDCGVPGCRNACPLGNFIPDWLEAAGRQDWQGAGELVHATSPLPEICGRICPQYRLCEGGCTRGRLEGAVTIGMVERGIAERALEAGWRPARPARSSGRRVLVVGAGPAGLGCAERLNRAGVEVSLYDRDSRIGGLLHSGVPSFKLDKTLLERRQRLLDEAGIHFHLGVTVDYALLEDLLVDVDGVFLGLGAQRSRTLDLPGQQLAGVSYALEWLAGVNTRPQEALTGQRLVVLGGGDTAIDCARAARRLGAQVSLAYRGPADAMRASPKEIALAQEEGVELLFEHVPVGFVGDKRVSGVICDTPGGQIRVAGEQLILAFGQLPDPPPWLAQLGIELTQEGHIQVGPRGATSHPKVWAGGDNTRGPDLAVSAIAAGRAAAEEMLERFRLLGRLRGRQ